MYKSPELSAKARIIREELASNGIEVPQSIAMKVAAKADGFKSVHVAQAKKNRQGLSAHAIASRQAAQALFSSLGKYERDIDGLFITIESILSEERSSVIEARFHTLTHVDGVKLSSMGDMHRWEEMTSVYETLRQNLLKTLIAEFEPKADGSDAPQFCCQVLDWRVSDGTALEELPPHHRQSYELSVKRSGHQFYIDLAPAHASAEEIEGMAQLAVFVEINRGLPCVHLSNSLYGDSLLSVFGTKEGLYLRPNEEPILHGAPDPSTQLGQLHEEDSAGPMNDSRYRAFIPSPA